MREIVENIMKEIPGCLGVGIYDLEKKTELAVKTLIPGHNPKAAAEAYTGTALRLSKALSYLPSQIGDFKNFSIITQKTVLILYRVKNKPLVLGVVIPKGANIGLARVIIEKYLKLLS